MYIRIKVNYFYFLTPLDVNVLRKHYFCSVGMSRLVCGRVGWVYLKPDVDLSEGGVAVCVWVGRWVWVGVFT